MDQDILRSLNLIEQDLGLDEPLPEYSREGLNEAKQLIAALDNMSRLLNQPPPESSVRTGGTLPSARGTGKTTSSVIPTIGGALPSARTTSPSRTTAKKTTTAVIPTVGGTLPSTKKTASSVRKSTTSVIPTIGGTGKTTSSVRKSTTSVIPTIGGALPSARTTSPSRTTAKKSTTAVIPTVGGRGITKSTTSGITRSNAPLSVIPTVGGTLPGEGRSTSQLYRSAGAPSEVTRMTTISEPILSPSNVEGIADLDDITQLKIVAAANIAMSELDVDSTTASNLAKAWYNKLTRHLQYDQLMEEQIDIIQQALNEQRLQPF